MVFDDVRQDAEIAVRIGILMPRFKMGAAHARKQRLGILPPEDPFRIRAVKHRQRPIVAQARLVVAKVRVLGWGVRRAGR